MGTEVIASIYFSEFFFYTPSHHKIRIPIGLVADEILVQQWILKLNRKEKALRKKSKRKVQGVPQSQTAALPRPQEEEETDKSKQAQTKQTYEKH